MKKDKSSTIEWFRSIKKKWGSYSSFCIWGKSKSDLTVFDSEEIAFKLNPRIVFLGINASRQLIRGPFGNGHDDRSGSSGDANLMNAIKGTQFEGAYFTDLFKDCVETKSGKVFKHFESLENHAEKERSFSMLRDEISDVCGDEKPLFVLLSKTKKREMERFFQEFCEYCGFQFDYLVTYHYSSYPKGGAVKAIKTDLRLWENDAHISAFFTEGYK